jgi:hypothetical protein
MILAEGKRSIRRKTCSSATSFFTNPVWIGLRSKPVIRGERPETKLSEPCHDRELFFCYSWYQTLSSEDVQPKPKWKPPVVSYFA